MSSTIRTLSVLLTGAAFAGAAPPLFAQDSPGEQAQDNAAEVGDTALDDESSAIVVTGTRIRGARVIGEVIELDRETIVEAGQVDLGEAIRSLPQNFSGGQNPGVGSGAGLINSNVNSAASANLRGLGLVVDLLKRARGSQHVLRVIGRIVNDPAELGVCRR